ncbi:glycosyltransferase family 4 protein [Butyricimonas paravirosa]|uniref:glycosyltransferase family 4 protein n=1 Tax=Butyricimonas paravirosa TaxID=1472417 RepID=UPI0022E90559|nr:glycosyltransferase family 4 protein [Butyricimonas paravirosa]
MEIIFKMNILLINHYAGSPKLGMEFRPYYLGREWVRLGHHVMIVAGSYSHLRKQQPATDKETIEGIEYRWIPLKPYKGNGLGRVRSIFDFVRKLWFSYSRYIGEFKPDVVIASSTYPIDIYPARKIAQRFGAKLVYEVHDLWPLSPMELGGYSKYHPFIMVMQAAEDYCYCHADKVVSLLPNALEHMKERGMDEKKFVYIPNGFDPEEWKDVIASSRTVIDLITDFKDNEKLPVDTTVIRGIDKLKNDGKFIVGFAGAHGIANSLYAVINAVAKLRETNIVLVLVGTGNEKDNLMNYVKKRGIGNVYFFPPVAKISIPEVLTRMDCLYIGLQKQPLFRFGISPNKMFDYMMAARPIIQAIEAGNNMVKEAGNGFAVEPDNVDEICNAIITMKHMDEITRFKLGLSGRSYALARHAYPILAKRFVNSLDN